MSFLDQFIKSSYIISCFYVCLRCALGLYDVCSGEFGIHAVVVKRDHWKNILGEFKVESPGGTRKEEKDLWSRWWVSAKDGGSVRRAGRQHRGILVYPWLGVDRSVFAAIGSRQGVKGS